jgi:hypothetical protein
MYPSSASLLCIPVGWKRSFIQQIFAKKLENPKISNQFLTVFIPTSNISMVECRMMKPEPLCGYSYAFKGFSVGGMTIKSAIYLRRA